MSKSRGAALAFLALAVAACGNHKPRDPGTTAAPEAGLREASIMDWKGPFCGVAAGSHRVVKSEPDWRKLWSDIGQSAPPAPDFKQHIAVAVFLGQRNTGGYGIKWVEPAGGSVVRYQELKPRGVSIQVLTQPFAVRLFPRTASDITVEAVIE